MNIITNKDNTAELIVKKSRFIASSFYVENEEDVKNILNKRKKEFADAKHHVYAYKINDKIKFSDDGEPQGTGGKPVLSLIENYNMNYCLIIVSRIFGGILLGTGGLTRSYLDSAKLSLEKTDIKNLIDGIKYDVNFTYENLSIIKQELQNITNLKIDNINYEDNVSMSIYFENENEDMIYIKLMDITNGKIKILNKNNIQYVM